MVRPAESKCVLLRNPSPSMVATARESASQTVLWAPPSGSTALNTRPIPSRFIFPRDPESIAPHGVRSLDVKARLELSHLGRHGLLRMADTGLSTLPLAVA